MEDISPPSPPPSEDRSTLTAEQLQAIVGRALHASAGQATTVAGQALALQAADANRDDEARYVAAVHALGKAQLAQARTDAIRSTATVGMGTLSGFLIGGPIGAVIGGGVGWLWDGFNDPHGR